MGSHSIPKPEAVAEGMANAETAARKRAAAPSWSDLGAAFGEQGFVRDARGKIKGYRYPKSDDPAVSAVIAKKAYELWEPHRRVSVEAGAKVNANVRLTTLENPQTGQVREVDVRQAEAVARKHGFVERAKWGRRQGDFSVGTVVYRNGSFQRYMGDDRWVEA